MKILITSGGTKIPIDPVRDITNKSHGTFASYLADHFIMTKDYEVVFYKAKYSKSPRNIGPEKLCKSYLEHEFVTFDDYYKGIKVLCEEKPDIVVLAAAVSDYTVENYSNNKIKSSEELVIRLKPNPKVISEIKEWIPDTKLVGFKMLINASDEELIEAAQKSLETNKCDLVVANNYNDILAGKHKIIVVKKDYVQEYKVGPSLELFREIENL